MGIPVLMNFYDEIFKRPVRRYKIWQNQNNLFFQISEISWFHDEITLGRSRQIFSDIGQVCYNQRFWFRFYWAKRDSNWRWLTNR